jgi:hypothetical protein
VKWALLAGVIALAGLVAWLALGGPSTKLEDKDKGTGENPLAEGRRTLSGQPSLLDCRNALQFFNNYLVTPEYKPPRPPVLTAEQRKALGERFGLSEAALGELEASNFTLLDGQYLWQCFVLRDAAQAIEVASIPGETDISLTPLERARNAFEWVVRQVRLHETNGPVTPPTHVLYRGWGSALERALVFLAMLEQLPGNDRPVGCLVFCPDLWACGVVAGNGKDIYLFDPRLGLPIPGKAGPIATLAEAAGDPEVLKQLTVKDEYKYDVDAAQAKKAELKYVTSLSGLAPRMRFLQDELLAPTVTVRLAVDSDADLERLERAAKASGCKGQVQPWNESWPDGKALPGVEVLRRFLPPAEGGTDQTQPGRLAFYRIGMVAWNEMPDVFKALPPNIGLGLRVRNGWESFWVRTYLDAGGPRDLILRGRYDNAAKALVGDLDQVREHVERFRNAENLDKQVAEWITIAEKLYADQLRAQSQANPDQLAIENATRVVEAHWKVAEPIAIKLEGTRARVRKAEDVYLLALCKHEVAEELQQRLDLQRRDPTRVVQSDVDNVQQAWEDARGWWIRFTSEYPDAPAAERLCAICQARLGQTGAAVKLWQNPPAKATPLEKVAAEYLASRAKK